MRYPYLKDPSFLKEIDESRDKEIFVKVTSLSFQDEKPIQEVQSMASSGNINISGSSSMRRTGSLTLVLDSNNSNIEDINNLFSIGKKIKLETGITNKTTKYTDFPIIWFPLGIYILDSPKINYSESGITLSLSFKDKMSLLNGDYGGIIPAMVNLSEYEDTILFNESGSEVEKKVIKKLTLYEIIKELVNHFGGVPLSKITISDLDTIVKTPVRWNPKSATKTLYYCRGGNNYYFSLSENEETIKKYKKGDEIGFFYTDFIWPYSGKNPLTSKEGETVCSVLDKIINVIPNFEYFFDLDGNFVFQEKKNYLNTSKSTSSIGDTQNYSFGSVSQRSEYFFTESNLITAYNNEPKYSQIKNDFLVWGKRKLPDNTEVDIRYHLAIDEKPNIGNSHSLIFLKDGSAKVPKVVDELPITGLMGVVYDCKSQYYMYNVSENKWQKIAIDSKNSNYVSDDWRNELYLQGTQAQYYASDSNYYYAELCNEWPKLYDIKNKKYKKQKDETDLDYYLDIIDDGSVAKLGVSAVGRRTKIYSNKEINCIFEPYVEDIIICKTQQDIDDCKSRGIYTYIDLTSAASKAILDDITSDGGTYNSAYNVMAELLYQYTTYNNAITLTTLPIYYLEANTRITAINKESNINGDYVINSISLPLGIEGTMTISATKAEQKM